MTKIDAARVDTEALIHAAIMALECLADMTTDAFAKGADREPRRALAAALGLNPEDYSL